MSRKCVGCGSRLECQTKYGYFVRESEQKRFQRFKCGECGYVFSQCTFQSCYRQKKRKLNRKILELLCSGMSQRRIAKVLKINRKTVARRLIFLAKRVRQINLKKFKNLSLITHMQFDDLETIEHTKCKPLSVTLAVERGTRRILGFKVSKMQAKGHLAKKAFEKYGHRQDQRAYGRAELFKKLVERVSPTALIESDQNPHYRDDVRTYFPHAKHKAFLGQRGAVTGQGELKKIAFDPLFSLNHTFAMLRANINRLFRKTWCTTKDPLRLNDHIELYTYYHNEFLLKAA